MTSRSENVSAWWETRPARTSSTRRRSTWRVTGVGGVVEHGLAEGGEDLRALPLRERRARLEALIAAHPGERLKLSPVVDYADWETLGRLRADPRLKTLAVPLLFVIPENDKLVAPKAAYGVAATLPDAQVARFGKEAAHEILREVDAVRNRAIGAIDAFLAQRAGGKRG